MIKLPSWMRRQKLQLPSWAKVKADGNDKVALIIEADTAGYVAEWFELLGVQKPDQYWLEVAFQCAKLDLQSALAGTSYDPRTNARPVEFHFTRADQCALRRFPVGRGVEAASKGKEARGHYKRIRGSLPF